MKAISACVLVAGATAAGGLLFATAASSFGWSAWYVVAGAVLSSLMGLAFCSGQLRASVGLGCFGCILQPSLIIAPACDGQMTIWPIVGAVLGFMLGRTVDEHRHAIVGPKACGPKKS